MVVRRRGPNLESMAKKSPRTYETAFAFYREVRVIGEGGCGTVFEVVDDAGRSFALKRLDPRKATKERRKRFENEYRFSLSEPNEKIVRVVDHGLDEDGNSFFVMPLYEASLRPFINGRPSGDDALRVFAKMLDGVEAAHLLGVVHRDLKPENILMNRDGSLVVADFGIAHFGADQLHTFVKTGPKARLANFRYAAPEQREPGGMTDPRTDIYALGLMLNELFTGRIPHGTKYQTIGDVAPNFEFLDELVTEMLVQDLDDRMESVRSVKKELIGRKKAFVALQELDHSLKKVVKKSDISDPLYDDPVTIRDADWEDEELALTLDQPVTPLWIQAFQNMGSHSAVWGAGPEDFRFVKTHARVRVEARSVQQAVDHFKAWMPQVHSRYRLLVDQRRREAEEHERERIEEEVQRREARSNVLRDLKY